MKPDASRAERIAHTRRWYWNSRTDAAEGFTENLHWEMLKYCNRRELSFSPESDGMDRKYNKSDIGAFRAELSKRFRGNENDREEQSSPLWDFYASTSKAAATVEIARDQFAAHVEDGESAAEIAERYGLVPDDVASKIEDLKANRARDPMKFSASYQDLKAWRKHRYDPPATDLVLDIDGHGDTVEEQLENAREKAIQIRDLFDEEGLEYWIKFSGGQGYHFHVDREVVARVFGGRDKCPGVMELLKNWGDYIEHRTGLTYKPKSQGGDIDAIHKERLPFRVPYSVHPSTGLVCVPIKHGELDKFDPWTDADPKILRDKWETPDDPMNSGIRGRGTCTRNGDASLIRKFDEWRQANDLDAIDPATNDHNEDPGSASDVIKEQIRDKLGHLSEEERAEFINDLSDGV